MYTGTSRVDNSKWTREVLLDGQTNQNNTECYLFRHVRGGAYINCLLFVGKDLRATGLRAACRPLLKFY